MLYILARKNVSLFLQPNEGDSDSDSQEEEVEEEESASEDYESDTTSDESI